MPVFTPKQKTWTQSGPGAGNPRRYEMDYDPAEQLTGAVLRDMTDNVILKGYGYRYDDAGNRAGTQVSTPQAGGSSAVALTTDTSNTVNQLTSRAGGSGAMTFEGTVNEPANVTVGGQAAQVWKNGDNTFGFRATATLAAGVNSVEIKATDASNNTNTQHTSVTVAGAGIPALSYDANGNTLNDGTRNYVWDAANQMVAIIYGAETAGNRTEFTYDGAGRRVRMVEYTAGAAPVIRRFVWAGLTIVEERDANNAPVKRYYSQGFQSLNTQPSTLNTFYSRDHLGSIRQHINAATGTVLASYNYDPYGNLETTSGPPPDFAYTGHLYHARSGLYFAPYREYSAELGRWMSRDPIEEEGGLNLYGYVENNPMANSDPNGLCPPAFAAIGLAIGEVLAETALLDYIAAAVGGAAAGTLLAEATDTSPPSPKKKCPPKTPAPAAPPAPPKPPKKDDDKKTTKDLEQKEKGIKEEWPDQPAGRTNTNLKSLLRDIARGGGQE